VTMDDMRHVIATFTNSRYALDLDFAGNGEGSVTLNPDGTTCETDCDTLYDHGTQVTLTPVSSATSHFAGWSGVCNGTGLCVVNMEAAQQVSAAFVVNEYDLSVSVDGTGSGSVISDPAGVDCGDDCADAFAHGTVVTLTAVSNTGSTFTGWSGACSGTEVCVVTVDTAQEVAATFTLNTYDLDVNVLGDGVGHITSDPVGIDCDGSCTASFVHGTTVTLTAVPATDSSFDGWDGACADTSGLVCTLLVEGGTEVSATFNAAVIEYFVYLPVITQGD
jgi:large repetitive protein